MKNLIGTVLLFVCVPAFAQHQTIISTRYDDDRVIVNNEFIGTGTGKIDLSTVADTYIDDRGVIRAKEVLTIKATPGNKGSCSSSIIIMYGDRIPKRVSLDTNICRSSPTIDLNIN